MHMDPVSYSFMHYGYSCYVPGSCHCVVDVGNIIS